MSGDITVSSEFVSRTIRFEQDVDSARGPNWYKAECVDCDTVTTGSASVVQEWAYEHCSEPQHQEHETTETTIEYFIKLPNGDFFYESRYSNCEIQGKNASRFLNEEAVLNQIEVLVKKAKELGAHKYCPRVWSRTITTIISPPALNTVSDTLTQTIFAGTE